MKHISIGGLDVSRNWLLAQGDDIAPIPGTKRVARVEENTAADLIELSAEQIARLNHLTPAAGARLRAATNWERSRCRTRIELLMRSVQN